MDVVYKCRPKTARSMLSVTLRWPSSSSRTNATPRLWLQSPAILCHTLQHKVCTQDIIRGHLAIAKWFAPCLLSARGFREASFGLVNLVQDILCISKTEQASSIKPKASSVVQDRWSPLQTLDKALLRPLKVWEVWARYGLPTMDPSRRPRIRTNWWLYSHQHQIATIRDQTEV